MTIPRVFAPIKKGDFTITPITVHKKYVIQRSDLFNGSTPNTGSGYKLLEARYTGEKLKLGTDIVYPTNSFDGSYQHIVWKQLDAMYYRYPTFSEGSNSRFTYKFLNYSASIIQIPQHDFGEGIKPGSVEFTGSNLRLRDDGNGNLYYTDSAIDIPANNKNLMFLLTFDDTFRLFKDKYGVIDGSLTYTSRTFRPDELLQVRNVQTAAGLILDSAENGISGYFNGSSSILIPPRNEYQFDGDYSISMWLLASNLPETQVIFSKRGTIKRTVLNSSDNTIFEILNESTNVYPLQIDISGSMINFHQSNGIQRTDLGSCSLDDGSWTHVGATVSGSVFTIYKYGQVNSQSSNWKSIRNGHSIVLGSLNTDNNLGLVGNLDEVRWYDKAISHIEMSTNSNVDYGLLAHQTPIFGNIFYKTGKIVLTPHDFAQWGNLFGSNFTLKYRNTHTIYQYETLCRIKKGDFNLTQNPTARQSPYSDLLINEMTSSVEDGGMPTYFNSVGLYNDAGELLVIGKMGQNIRNRDDVDLNLIVRFDT